MKLSYKNSNLHYFQAGQGDPLVFLHGFPDCAVNYKEQIEFFSANGFEVFVPLMPGYHENDQELDTYQSLKIAEELSLDIKSINPSLFQSTAQGAVQGAPANRLLPSTRSVRSMDSRDTALQWQASHGKYGKPRKTCVF